MSEGNHDDDYDDTNHIHYQINDGLGEDNDYEHFKTAVKIEFQPVAPYNKTGHRNITLSLNDITEYQHGTDMIQIENNIIILHPDNYNIMSNPSTQQQKLLNPISGLTLYAIKYIRPRDPAYDIKILEDYLKTVPKIRIVR